MVCRFYLSGWSKSDLSARLFLYAFPMQRTVIAFFLQKLFIFSLKISGDLARIQHLDLFI